MRVLVGIACLSVTIVAGVLTGLAFNALLPFAGFWSWLASGGALLIAVTIPAVKRPRAQAALTDLEIKLDWTGTPVVSLDRAVQLLDDGTTPKAGIRAALIAQQTTPGSSVPVAAVERMMGVRA